ncbi:MAG: hypothetical protein EXR61_00500 [Chloroflexi bacterium]|nr:hypothetical protein [Chloroflexota bacterium]
MRRRLALAAALALVLLWGPLIRPAGRATVLLLDLFSGLVGTDLASLVSPLPRVREGTGSFDGVSMRVTTWEPGWGDRHPALLIVNGASPAGNDNALTRQFGRALARAGFLAVLPEFPFLKEARFEEAALGQLDSAFAAVRGAAAGEHAGAFGSSIGGGLLLAAASRGQALRSADELIVLGAYFDLDTYVASVASGAQTRAGAVVPWRPSAEVRERLPLAALAAVSPAGRPGLEGALLGSDHHAALSRLRALPQADRVLFDALSPRSRWSEVAPPVFWIHDPDDNYEPIAEAEAARDAPRTGSFRLAAPALIQHAEVVAGDRGRGPLFVIGELVGLLGCAIEVMRVAG